MLKRGGGIETLLGSDDSGDLVVLKMASGEALSTGCRCGWNMKRECCARCAVRGWRTLLDLGRDRDRLYLVMPYVPGVTLEQRLARGRLSVPRPSRLAAA